MRSWYVKGMSWAGALRGSDNGEPAKRRVVEPTQEDAWRDERILFWGLHVHILTPSEGKPASTGVRWFLAKSGVGAVARDKIGRRIGDVGANCVWGICSTIIAKKE